MSRGIFPMGLRKVATPGQAAGGDYREDTSEEKNPEKTPEKTPSEREDGGVSEEPFEEPSETPHDTEDAQIEADIDLQQAVDTLFSSLSRPDVSGVQGQPVHPNKGTLNQSPGAEPVAGNAKASPQNGHIATPSSVGNATNSESDPSASHPRSDATVNGPEPTTKDIVKAEYVEGSIATSGPSISGPSISGPPEVSADHPPHPSNTHGSLPLPAETQHQTHQPAPSPSGAFPYDTVKSPQTTENSSSEGRLSNTNGPSEAGDKIPGTNYNNDADDDDHDLENAIGDAFKNLVHDMNTNQSKPSEPQPHHNAESPHSSQHNETPSDEKEDFDDTNLEDAIGEAFKSLANGFGEHDSVSGSSSANDSTTHEQDSDSTRPRVHVSQSFPSNTSYNRDVTSASQKTADQSDSQMAVDINSIVQSVVSQIEHLDGDSTYTPTEQSAIPREVLQNLASEISNQVVTSDSAEHIPEYHSIRATEAADSQAQPSKDDPSQDLDAALKAAVANAVKSAFPTGNTNLSAQVAAAPQKEADLEQLQMNEILQNAFNMAMQYPQELLTSLDAAEELNSQKQSEPDHSLADADADADAGVLSSATTLAALSAKQQLHQKDGRNRLPESATNDQRAQSAQSGKPLSIAETLALHRANMSHSSQRDYSAIKSLEDSVRSGVGGSLQPASQSHPQLSNILSSLSQHIQSGTHSSNLMSVIRQMTNALMHNKKFPASFSKAGQEMIKNIKSSPDEKNFFMTSFQKTKRFILTMEGDESKQKASTLISNILESIDSRKSKSSPNDSTESSSEEQLGKDLEEDLHQYYDAAFSTITSLDIPRLRLAIAGVKPELDSSEHRSRVREGNRERKKKWREGNAERNKDNDLRCRVLKRAALKFGESSSDEKSAWIEKEYTKRRNRRISRQKKDEVRTESPPPSEEPPSEDPLLVNKITDCFNVVSECGFDDDPRAVLLAISAAVAVAASSCAEILGLMDVPTVINSMNSILTSIFEACLRSGASRKFVFLVKREDHQYTTKNAQEMSKEELLRKIAALQALNPSSGPEISPSMSALEALRQSQKRLGPAVSDPYPKKPKIGDGTDSGLPNYLRDSSNSWSPGSNLRMPSYRKPSGSGPATDPELLKMEISRREFVEPIPKITSPFISNKLGNDTSSYARPNGFKKTGGLQRPVFSKSTNKSKSLGFPTLYSTSFRSN
ncbi:hypothetical protein JCM33374_g6094 [Metschnikowia sp. JCM 33374]|nr:hypothetical protein JCM33374_g6094 [Metschnikowia sp. JCM 33374]